MFTNVTDMYINITDERFKPTKFYPFSLISLLSLIENSNMKEVTIEADYNENIYSEKLRESAMFISIQNAYKAKKFKMKFNEWNTKLIISRE